MEDPGDFTRELERMPAAAEQQEEAVSGRHSVGGGGSNRSAPRFDPHEERPDHTVEAALFAGTKEMKRRPKLKRMKLQFYKTKMCPWMAQGRCLRGLSCQYAHSEIELSPLPNLLKTRMCEALTLTGSCPRSATECRFAHSAEELRSTEIFARSKMCPLFLAGQCRANEKCRYAHSAQELRKASVASALFLQKHPCRQLQADTGSVGTATVTPGGVNSTENTRLVEKGTEGTADDTGTSASPSSSVAAACSITLDAPARFTVRYPVAKPDMTKSTRSSTRRPHSGIPLQSRIMPSVFLCTASAGESVRRQSCSERGTGSFSHPGSPKGCVGSTSQCPSPPGGGRQIQAIARLYCASQPPPPPEPSPPAMLPNMKETPLRLSQPTTTEQCQKNKVEGTGTVARSDESDNPHAGDGVQKFGSRKGRDGSGHSLSRRGTSCSSSRTSASSLGVSRENTAGQLGALLKPTEKRGARKVVERQGGQGLPLCILEMGLSETRGTSTSAPGLEPAPSSITEAPKYANEVVSAQAPNGDTDDRRVSSLATRLPRSSIAGEQPSGSAEPLALTPAPADPGPEQAGHCVVVLGSESESSGQEKMTKASGFEQRAGRAATANDRVPFQWHWRSVSTRRRYKAVVDASVASATWVVQDRPRSSQGSVAHSSGSAAAIVIGSRPGPEQGMETSLPRRSNTPQGSTAKFGNYPATGNNRANVRQHHLSQHPAQTFVRPVFSTLTTEQQHGHAWSYVQTGGYLGSSTTGSWPYQYEGVPGSTMYPCEQGLPSFTYVPDGRLVSPDSCMSRTSFTPQSSGSTVATPHGVPAVPFTSPAGGSVLTACQSQGGGCEIAEQRASPPSVHSGSALPPSGVVLYGSPVDNATFYSGGCGVAAAFSGGMDRQRELLYLPQAAVGQSMQCLPPEVLLPKVSAEVLKASQPDRYED